MNSLNGRYELLHPLGVGGMAEVFKGRTVGSAGFSRDVVIKRILPAHGRDPEFVKMFVDEARILSALYHPNIVQAYDFGEEDGMPFLALEYIEGPSLARVMRCMRTSKRTIPPAVVAYVAREVCRALDYVHNLCDADGKSLEVIHRDVTPSNIMLTPVGGVKLLDFGVAKFTTAAQLTDAGTVKGKPAYLAPEQLEGKKIDGRVDLFALGIVMHEMLSLHHLFAGDSDIGTIMKIMESEIPKPSSVRRDVSPELDRIVLRALSRDRDHRYDSAAQMARDLDEFVIASRLRIDEVAAFVREVESTTSASTAPRIAPRVSSTAATTWDRTRRDLGMPLRMLRARTWLSRPRGVALAAAAAVAIIVSTALGFHVDIKVTRSVAAAAQIDSSHSGAVACPSEPLLVSSGRSSNSCR